MSADAERKILAASATAFVDAARESDPAFRPRFVSNDAAQGSKVLAALETELRGCTSFMFSVAFITEGGIAPLKQTLAELEARGVRGRILTTDYQLFNDPRTLAWLASRPNIDVRMFLTGELNGRVREGFHTKGYLFHRADGTAHALIGSSNLTDAALCTNREWNTRLVTTAQGELYRTLESEIEELWEKASPADDILDTYERIYRAKQEALAQTARQQTIVPYEQAALEPNGMQVSFVNEMAQLEDAGESRALLISATGTGKTYASAFAVRDENPRRMLFLAHREQILVQAMESYRRVLGAGKTFGLVSGSSRKLDADYVFATVQTMRQDDVLAHFKPDAFEFVVIDEVHHAAAASYRKIMDYFEPRMWLGMTASPDRTDNYDIYALFDHNIACEIRLQQAMENDLLCPFHYFGITDIAFEGADGNLAEDDPRLFGRLVESKRVDYILEKASYFGYSGERVKGLVFCSRLEEAKALSAAFNRRGLRTLCLSGKNTQDERLDAAERLAADEGSARWSERLDYLFSVDIFNEGVDIPQVNQVIMLRPTQSPVVFVQQLGRGLRKAAGKQFVVILDFIGNYANNYMIPLALSGDRSYNKDAIRKYMMEGNRIIPGCSSIHFDEIARERVFASIDNAGVSMKLLKEKYLAVKNKLGRIPALVDFQEHGEIDPLLFIEKKGSYPAFLACVDRDYRPTFTSDELTVLEYLSRFIANGMRPHELLMTQMLLDGKTVDEACFNQVFYEYCRFSPNPSDTASATRILDGAFIKSPADKRKYSTLELIHIDEAGNITESTSFAQMLSNPPFRRAVQDIVSFGLARYQEKYAKSEGALTLYEKYSRKDACRLLDWDDDESSTVYGYRVKFGTCPIFVTYRKAADISSSTQYDDAFVDRQTFSWMTRSRLKLDSDEVRSIAEAKKRGIDVHLFVKKSDDEGTSFYYMGRVDPRSPVQCTIEDDAGNKLPIVNFQLKLEHPVREDYYEYFVGEDDARAQSA